MQSNEWDYLQLRIAVLFVFPLATNHQVWLGTEIGFCSLLPDFTSSGTAICPETIHCSSSIIASKWKTLQLPAKNWTPCFSWITRWIFIIEHWNLRQCVSQSGMKHGLSGINICQVIYEKQGFYFFAGNCNTLTHQPFFTAMNKVYFGIGH